MTMPDGGRKSYAPRVPDMERWVMYKRVGARIRHYRNAKDETLHQVAAVIGCAATTLHKVETGGAPPPLHLVVACAKHFGVTMNDLVPMET